MMNEFPLEVFRSDAGMLPAPRRPVSTSPSISIASSRWASAKRDLPAAAAGLSVADLATVSSPGTAPEKLAEVIGQLQKEDQRFQHGRRKLDQQHFLGERL